MTNQIQFPVSIPNHWHALEDISIQDPYLKNWLLDTGSLTERLQSNCMHFDLTLIGQRPMQPELEEISQFSQRDTGVTAQKWQIREVLLSGNGQPWVFARSIIPQALCDMDFAGLGNKPLGQIIFNDSRFKRFPFQILHVPAGQNFQQKLGITAISPLWGRRSVFNFNQFQLMVAEVFLPNCPAYRQQESTHAH